MGTLEKGAEVKTHTTKDGRTMELCDMTDSHLRNTIRFIERRADEGVHVLYGGGGSCAEDMWCDADTIFGKEALEHLGHADYVKELERRERARK